MYQGMSASDPRRLWLVVVAAGAFAGLGLRLWALTAPFGALDGDEALWGLMSRHALDGELSVFFWGQNYGGTQETLATAIVFAAGATGTLALRAVPIVLFAVAAVLVWRVGRRTVGEPAARLAAVLFWVWPAYLVWKSTRAHGYYGAATVLGLCVLLFALRLRERDSWRDTAGLGVAVGLGWWATPQIAFVAAPVLVWLVLRRGVSRNALAAAACFVLGAAPWLVWNVENGFDSLHAGFGSGEDSYLNHLKIFFATALPYGLGLRVPFSFDWLVGSAFGRACELLAVGSLVWLVLRRRPLGSVEPLVVGALAYPFLFAISPFSFLNDEPRYLVLLVPVMALLVSFPLARRTATAAG